MGRFFLSIGLDASEEHRRRLVVRILVDQLAFERPRED